MPDQPSWGVGPNVRRLVAIMSADVAGYSRLMGLDEEGTHLRMTQIRRDIIDVTIAEHHGTLVKHMGDGFLATFVSPLEAARCAIVIQETVEARNASSDKKLRIRYRIGINLGDIIFQDGDIFGDSVNVAARLQSVAEPGCINISGGIYEQVKNKLVCGYQSLGDEKLKNITDPVRMYRVLPDPAALGRADSRSKRLLQFSVLVLVACLTAFGIGFRYASHSGGDNQAGLVGGVSADSSATRTPGDLGAVRPPRPDERPKMAALVSPPGTATPSRGADLAVVKPSAPPTRATVPAQTNSFRDCQGCPEMVLLTGGSFKMGDSQDWNARPIHDVSVPPLALGRSPVTNREWRECLNVNACSFAPDGDDDEPVRNVSWDDVHQYLAWLSKAAGKIYRLPNEAEWEYAARGGTTTAYWWGARIQPGLADCRGCGDLHDSARPARLESLQPNPFGLVGMGGGVAEWVEDCWHASYQGAPRTGPWLAPNCHERVLRGGSWQATPDDIKVTSRIQYDAEVRYPTHGFRVAVTQE